MNGHVCCDSNQCLGTISRKFRVALLVVTFCMFLYLGYTYTRPVRFTFVNKFTNSACVITDIDPFDKSILQYLWHPDPIICQPSPSMVYIDNAGILQINTSATKGKNIVCYYQVVNRTDDNNVNLCDKQKYLNPVYISSDFLNVECYLDNSKIFEKVLYNVDFKSVTDKKDIAEESQENLSVFIFGVDSVSRLSAERKLLKTISFLRNDLKAYTFKGYTSVGGVTYSNLIPALTGKPAYSKELPNLNPRTDYTDPYPFIWKDYARKKYVTMFSEDFPEISIFNYMLKGFKDPPTDHYLRPYYIARNTLHPIQWKANQVMMFLENKSIKFGKYSSLCYQNSPKHKIHLDHYAKFISQYKGRRKFAFSWITEISHDYMNFLELLDGDLYQMIKTLKRNGHLQNSIFILFGDHGPRTDEMRNTPIGRIEERMPLLTIYIPEHIKQRYPNLDRAMTENQNRLTSPYDLYETLKQIAEGNFRSLSVDSARPYPRGISMFRPIPEDRTCADGSIPEHSCACYTAHNVTIDKAIISIANFVVSSINSQLGSFKDICSDIKLLNVQQAQHIVTGLSLQKQNDRSTLMNFFHKPEDPPNRYLVLIETIPGNALFEATVSVHYQGRFSLLGDVSRTNRYNNQSHCITYKRLKPFCYCLDLV